MQLSASSDTLNTMAFSNAGAQSLNSSPQHDARQPLSHSQSMVLPENGKVLARSARTHKATCCVCGHSWRGEIAQKQNKETADIQYVHMHKYGQLSTANVFAPCLYSWWSNAEITPAM